MSKSPACSASPVPRIVFDRHKYGRHLLVDACRIRDIDDFTVSRRSHRLGFHEVALITRGSGGLELDDAPLPVAPRRILVTAPGEMRRWSLGREALDGWLVFFEAGFVDDFFHGGRFLEGLPIMAARPGQRSVAAAPRQFGAMVEIAEAMRGELQAPRADTEHALRAETYRLLVALHRAAAPALASAPSCNGSAVTLARRFEALLGESFARRHGVGDYAEALGVSARHLNGCVRDALGLSASQAIHARQYLEARRLLIHTSLDVGGVAEELGFAEPSYFIRFFKRHAGTTPLAFRRRRHK